MNSELREFWEEKTRKALEKARKEEREKTERKKATEIAGSLLTDGSLSYEKIANFTGLTVEEVKQLSTQLTA